MPFRIVAGVNLSPAADFRRLAVTFVGPGLDDAHVAVRGVTDRGLCLTAAMSRTRLDAAPHIQFVEADDRWSPWPV